MNLGQRVDGRPADDLAGDRPGIAVVDGFDRLGGDEARRGRVGGIGDVADLGPARKAGAGSPPFRGGQ
jgi:hypothetical protein